MEFFKSLKKREHIILLLLYNDKCLDGHWPYINQWSILDLKSCCGDHCCNGEGFPSEGENCGKFPDTSTNHPFSHIHITSHHVSLEDKNVQPLEIASVWIAVLFSLLVFILLSRSFWRHFHTPPLLKRLRTYAEGPEYKTSVTAEGAIVPALNYFDPDEARDIVRRGKRGGQCKDGLETGKQYEKIEKKNEKRSMGLQILEMEFELLTWQPYFIYLFVPTQGV